MADAGSKYTDKKIAKLENQIVSVYTEAQKDIEQKIAQFNNKYTAKYQIHAQELADGKITQDQFDNWMRGQVFQGEQWKAKRDQIIKTIENANQIANQMVNGQVTNVFAMNANYQFYDIEHGTGINFGFGLYDNATVARLIKENPQILPEWKIDEPKDYVWNAKKVNNAITQGIIQGESLDKIADRLSTQLCAQNRNLMLTHARTAMTGAQNAGRDMGLMQAKAKGIEVVKQWMATLDGRTRDSHRHLDGETIKVKDIWHPAKFSNGCRYPGDPQGPPQEVYNCRCTMVGDVQEYPSIYERYDNIDGKPIKNMTYDEWAKAKGGVGHTKSKYKKTEKTSINYAKYGGKEIVDLMEKYNFDYDNFSISSTGEEWAKVGSVVGGDVNKMEALFESAKKDLKNIQTKQSVEEKAAKEAEKKYEKAKADLAKIEQEIKDKGADKVFTGIWKDQNITYADYEAKKHTIEAKAQFYEAQIKSAKHGFAEMLDIPVDKVDELWDEFAKYPFPPSSSALDTNPTLRKIFDELALDDEDLYDIWQMYDGKHTIIEKTQQFLDDLREFEKHGEEYSKLLAERQQAKSLIASLKPKPDMGAVFADGAYTQARKDKALWAKSSKEADDALRQTVKDVWVGATQEERYAAWDYTAGSGKFNRPLRGYEGSWYNNKGVGNVPLNYEGAGEEIEALTNLIERTTLPQDTWLQRGVDTDGLAGFLKVPEDVLNNATEEELQQLLLGKEVSDEAFMSCGSSKGAGFSGNILNVYCPEGTQALYCEPFSYYGRGAMSADWDGISDQSSFGGELETLIQRNTRYRIVKVEKQGYRIYLDIDVVGQDPHGLDSVYK